MRIAVGEVAVQPDRIHQLIDAVELLGTRPAGVFVQRLGDDRRHGHAGVEAGLGVLKDHLHRRAQLPEPRLAHRADLGPVDLYRALGDVVKPQHRAPAGRLPAAGFAHNAQRLALVDVERDAIDGLHGPHLPAQDAADDGEMHLEAPNLDQLPAARAHTGCPVRWFQKQALSWSLPTGRRGGFSRWQRSKTCSHRAR